MKIVLQESNKELNIVLKGWWFQMLLDMKQIDDEIGEDMGYRGFANSAEENVKLLQDCNQMCRLVLKGLINYLGSCNNKAAYTPQGFLHQKKSMLKGAIQ